MPKQKDKRRKPILYIETLHCAKCGGYSMCPGVKKGDLSQMSKKEKIIITITRDAAKRLGIEDLISSPEQPEWGRDVLHMFATLSGEELLFEVKALISDLLSQQKAELREKVEGMMKQLNGANPNVKSFGDGEYTKQQELYCRIGALAILDDILEAI